MRRVSISPSMVVAVIALAVALGGSAYAADGGFAGPDGTIQGCVTAPGLINSITGNAGAVLIVSPGQSCPSGTKPLSLGGGQTVVSAHSAKPLQLGTSYKADTSLALTGGNYLVTGTTTISETGTVATEQLIKCVLLDPSGTAIHGTATYTTLPAGSSGLGLTIPISADLTNMPAGTISVACKDPAVTLAHGPRAFAAGPSPEGMYSSMAVTENAP